MINLRCKMCGGMTSAPDGATSVNCKYCGNTIYAPTPNKDIYPLISTGGALPVRKFPKAYTPKNGQYEPYIFVSYAHADSQQVFPIIEMLQEKGFRIWYDAGIEAGTEWPEYIAEHIEKCTCFLCFISESAIASKNCRQEISFALSENKELLSVYLSDIKPPSGLRMLLGNFQSLFLSRFSNLNDLIGEVCKAKIVAPCQGLPPVKKKIDFYNDDSDEMYEAGDSSSEEEIERMRKIIISIFAEENVGAEIIDIERGASVTRFIIKPNPETKIKDILGLKLPISLALNTLEIRIVAPIPGKNAIAIEVPKRNRDVITFKSVITSEEFKSNSTVTSICIGRAVDGDPIIADIARLPHLLVAGVTGTGKSIAIKSMLATLLLNADPNLLKLILIDPKRVEFTSYNGVPHLLSPVICDPRRAIGALMWAVDEVDRRYKLIADAGVRNITAYNEKVSGNEEAEKLPFIVIVIDELADLMLMVRDPIESLITRIAQKARAAGIHLIIGTQRPTVKVITGIVKANIPSRLCCMVTSETESIIVLDTSGAEMLNGKGDALYHPVGAIKPMRIQCAFLPDDELDQICSHVKSKSGSPTYEPKIPEYIENYLFTLNNPLVVDDQFNEAVELTLRLNRVSTSLLQRSLSIGYAKAAKFIDEMEELGIVSEMDGSKARKVLMSPEEWKARLEKIQKPKK